MPKAFISEDDIEQSILKLFEQEKLDYNILKLDASPEKMEVLPDGTGRSDKKECVLPEILWNSLKKLNPGVKEAYLKQVYDSLINTEGMNDLIDVFTNIVTLFEYKV